jgi:cell wall assembly regulator SMI1
MNTHLEALVDRIFGHLRDRASVTADRRRAGLSPEYVEAAIQDLGLQMPDDLRDLYSYCDGTSTFEGDVLGEIQFFPGFYWMSLEDALISYRAVSKSEGWNRAWLPIFANGGGDFYAVVCENTSPYFGEVVGFVLGEPDQMVEFRTVTSLFETIDRSFSHGAFFVSDGRLKADYSKMRAIARMAQPGFTEHEV